ncbi:DUF3418 domain-containing protein [Nakamurella endophytica]|uniref:ATP-dependent helicase HrpA n=1 Tax=Nakamurella endophytica TaxID=1748367 RepID=A0A917SMZ5_9ACTN|nr:DUF3418 domain-containing protein [Nakamurella endophytica]GGL89915.1 hypothetical protein GCM10011594_06970 [Nakamurella endophytica]
MTEHAATAPPSPPDVTAPPDASAPSDVTAPSDATAPPDTSAPSDRQTVPTVPTGPTELTVSGRETVPAAPLEPAAPAQPADTAAASAHATRTADATHRTPPSSRPDPAALADRIALLGPADRRRLDGRLARIGRRGPADRRRAALAEVAAAVDRAEARLRRRRDSVPRITYPAGLPVAERVDDLAAAIRDHQVVVVAGETGSGKSTQLPKICLALGRGVGGMIGHTQPRRIAARALAERIAEETGTSLGGPIGYTVRFGDHTGPDTLVKLMTDGILLAEIHRDRDLLAYDTIIVDEAHERSLTIDFLLGYLTELLPRRPDLKVLITSATIDPQRFSRFFADAPVVEVSGRTYPVEIRYRPWGADVDGDEDADGTGDDLDTEDDTPTNAGGAAPGGRDHRPTGGRRDATGGARGGPEGARDAGRRGGRDTEPRGGRAGDGVDLDQTGAILAAVDELCRVGPGDILVFLSGEREITDTADALRGHLSGREAGTEILPLYGRLSAADQHRVFSEHTGRRIVLSTNVAETSLTVPGIRYVVDPGTARISRYSSRTKVQRLPIEKISQASAGQRAGRCGRVAEGVCIRLYSAEDFAARPRYTDPEILRTSLASVILQMASLELGDVASFPFLDPPETRQITDGVAVLNELGALQPAGDHGGVRLTDVGRRLASLPVDPRLARMIVEGERRGVLDELLVIASALGIQDVREYPLEDRDRAVAAHARFVDPSSDFLAHLHLWHYLRAQAAQRSGNSFRRMCRAEYLHYLRIREWQDLHAQLRQLVDTGDGRRRGGRRPGRGDGRDRTAGDGRAATTAGEGDATSDGDGAPPGTPDAQRAQGRSPSGGRDRRRARADGDAAAHATQQGRGSLATEPFDTVAVHTAVLSGLLSHLGRKVTRDRPTPPGGRRTAQGRDYDGARGASFVLWPGSAVAKSPPDLVVAAELVETARLWGRTVAAVDPRWVEDAGAALVKRSHSEPRWDARRASVVATERVTLFGVTVVPARTVQFDRIDPVLSRELFLRHALVERDWETRHAFFSANERAMREVSEREDRIRRRNLLLDDEALYQLYDERIPAEVTSGRHFDAWWRRESRRQPDLLTFTPEMLLAAGADDVDLAAFPDRMTSGGLELDLDYVFDPGRADDGVATTVPLAALAQVDPQQVDTVVPGARQDLAVALIRSLPKHLRRNFVPAPDVAAQALRLMPPSGPVAPALADALRRLTGVVVRPEDFEADKVPDHLRMTYRIVDDDGRQVATGKDLAALRRTLQQQTRGAVAELGAELERTGLTAFPADGLPRQVTERAAGQTVSVYPALVDEGSTVGVRVFPTAVEQRRAMRAGTRRLLVLGARPPVSHVRNGLDRAQLLTISVSPYGSLTDLVADATEAAVDALLDWAGGPQWTADGYRALAARIEPQLPRAVLDILLAVDPVLRAAHEVGSALDDLSRAPAAAAWRTPLADMRDQLTGLMAPGFITRTTAGRLPELTRRLQALGIRTRRLRENPQRDLLRTHEVQALQRSLAEAVRALPPDRDADRAVDEARRLVDEYRIALFAQPMKPAVTVSADRIETAVRRLRELARD